MLGQVWQRPTVEQTMMSVTPFRLEGGREAVCSRRLIKDGSTAENADMEFESSFEIFGT